MPSLLSQHHPRSRTYDSAGAYVRVFTERQNEYALGSQRKLIREYATANDMDMPPEFDFVEDGASCRTARKRKAHLANDRAVMAAYGFSVRDFTEADCVAALMKLYQEKTQA